MRGSIRNVMVIESDNSLPAATELSMRRTSTRVSAQKAASDSSRSKRGTSSQLEMAFIKKLLGQGLSHFSLIKKSVFRFERSGKNDAGLFAVGTKDRENAHAIGGHPEIEKTGLLGEARRIRHQSDCKRVLKRFLNNLKGHRLIQIKRWI